MKSLLQIIISTCLLLPLLAFGQIIEKPYCFQCDGNQAKGYKSMASGLGNTVLGNYAAGLGQNNISNGIGSLAAGVECEASGDYAQAFGNIVKATARSSFASGFLSEAHGVFSVAMGYGAKTGSHSAIALGFNVEALAPASFVTGRFVKSTASNAITIGSGIGVEDNEYLKNNFVSSFMVGFSSVNPTFFISNSPSGGDKTGKIGIGNVTAPSAKLHIKADATENATLYLESSDWENKFALIQLGTTQNTIKAEKNIGLSFFTEKDYIFNDGNVGIGTTITPTQKLEVAGNILAEKFYGDGSELEGIDDNLGDHVATENIQLAGHFLSGDGGYEGVFVSNTGQVGINTDEPAAKFHIASVNDSRVRLEYKDIAPMDNAISKFWDIHNTAGKLKFQSGSGSGEPSNLNLLVIDEEGNVGIGLPPDPNHKLEVDGDINFNGSLKQYGEIFETTKWQENGADLYYSEGNVGIGTGTPGEKLEVDGNITAQHINVSGIKLNNNTQGTGKLLQSDALGNATWVAPPPTDDGDWTINGSDIYRDGGMVGIGTQTPSVDLHINNDVVDITTTFLKIENNGTGIYSPGSTSIGKWAGSGPFIMQKAGTGLYYTGNEGLRLAFVQKNKNDTTGLSISTYMNYNGSVHFSDIYAEVSSLYLRANKTLFLRSGGSSPLVFETNGDNTDQGTRRMEINRYGQVGIGTTIHIDPETKFTVKGRIHAQEVKVTVGAGADFVFDEEYNLPGLAEIDTFIKANKHLPDIPSAEQMQTDGLDLGEMQIKLLQKIEELTLYVIELKKENKEVKGEIENLKQK